MSEILRMVEVVFPNTTNHYGTMFGGKVLDLMDRAAFICASRFSNLSMVTASTEHMDFFTPIRHGNLVELVAKVVFTGRASLIVRVDLHSEDPIGQKKALASQGYFHMVAVDEKGKSVPVPKMEIRTTREQEEWDYCTTLYEKRRIRKINSNRDLL